MLRRSFVSKDRSGTTLQASASSASTKRSSLASTKRSSRSSHLTKTSSRSSWSFCTDDAKVKLIEQFATASSPPPTVALSPELNSDIVTVSVGKGAKLFALHVDNLGCSRVLSDAYETVRGHNTDPKARRINLPDEQPEVFSAVLEYIYKGDYYPRLLPNRGSWYLEDVQEPPASPNFTANRGNANSVTVHLDGVGLVLRDSAIYCAAERFGLDDLKRLALRKQGLQSSVEIATILRSARYAYDYTPDSDCRLRGHFLSLIIKSRKTFAHSGTMQMDMEDGGRMYFDLFVAMCNQVDGMQQEMQV